MKLADYLAAQGLTATAFARKIGVHKSTITRAVRGESRPDWDTLREIVKETKGAVTANDFLEEETAA